MRRRERESLFGPRLDDVTFSVDFPFWLVSLVFLVFLACAFPFFSFESDATDLIGKFLLGDFDFP